MRRAAAAILALLSFLALGPAGGCSSPPAEPAPRANPEKTSQFASADNLDRFREKHNYRDVKRWVAFEVTNSVVTGGRRRIYFEKSAVTRALLERASLPNGGGSGAAGAPMRYPRGTVFVVENLRTDGSVRDTEVLLTRNDDAPEFLLFDAQGERRDTYAQANDPPSGPEAHNTPRVCLGCHMGNTYFDPMMSFPNEPVDRRVAVDSRMRSGPAVALLLEGFHRGDHLFGPYGALWLAKLASDARDGTLTPADRSVLRELRPSYPDFLPSR